MLVLQGHQDQVTCLAYAPDGRSLASAGNDRTVRVWDLSSGQSVRVQVDLPTPAVAVAFSPDGATLAIGEGETINLCNARRLGLYDAMTVPGGVRVLVFAPDGKAIFVGSSNRRLERRAPTGAILGVAGWNQSIYAVAVAPDGKTIAVAGGIWPQTGGLALHHGTSLKPQLRLPGHQGVVLAAAFAPDGQTLATGSDDRTVRLWDVLTGQELHVLVGHEDLIRGLAFAPDGRTLTSVSWDGAVKVWDARSGRERTSFEWHTGMVHAVAFAPDGMTAATAGQDGTVVVWDVDSV